MNLTKHFIALMAWTLLGVASVRAQRFAVDWHAHSHIDGAVKATALQLAPQDIAYLEELYVPHALAGVMAQNGKQKGGNVV